MHEVCQSGLIVDLSGQVRYLVPQAARHSHVDTLDMGVCVCVRARVHLSTTNVVEKEVRFTAIERNRLWHASHLVSFTFSLTLLFLSFSK